MSGDMSYTDVSVQDPGQQVDLVHALKQLVVSCGPYIRQAGGEFTQVQQALADMEKHDENFHRYQLVKWLRERVESSLGKLTDLELEKMLQDHDPAECQEPIVATVVDALIDSSEYGELNQILGKKITKACDYLLENFSREFSPEEQQKVSPRMIKQKKSESYSSDGDSSFCDSSLNQSSFMFVTTERLKQITENLGTQNTLEVRQEAMKSLLHVATMDTQNGDMWIRIRQRLQEALSDPDHTLWTGSIKYISRGLAVNDACTKEMYKVICDHLISEYTRGRNIPRLLPGVDCQSQNALKLLKTFRLMNLFQQQVSEYWIRYSEKFVEEVLSMTVTLLSHGGATSNPATAIISPLHFLGLVDTRANWFIHWMHGHYSRSVLLKHLQKNPKVLEQAVKTCLDYVTLRKNQAYDLRSDKIAPPLKVTFGKSSSSRRMTYTGPEVEFAAVAHCLVMLGRILCYKQGQALFPVTLRDRNEQVTVTQLIVSLISLITETGGQTAKPTGQFDPGQMVTDLLKKLCVSGAECQNCMCQDSSLSALLSPISAWLDGPLDSSLPQPGEGAMLRVADILSAVASTDSGRERLLYGGTASRFTRSKSSAAHILTDFAVRALTDKLPSFGSTPSKAVLGSLVFTCRQLYSTCQGLYILYPYNLHTAVATAWRVASREADQAATPTPSTDAADNTNSDRHSSQFLLLWEDTLRDNLLNFANTPKGVLLLQQTGAMVDCAAYMYSRYQRKLQVSKCEKFGYGYMLSQVVSTSPGMSAILNTGYEESLVTAAWSTLEVISDKPVTCPHHWSTDKIDKSSRKALSSLVTLLSSHLAVYEMLWNQPLPERTDYGFREPPVTVLGLFDRLVFVDTPNKMHSLFNYDQSHMFGLRLLSQMIGCLDTMLLLQNQYDFQSRLLQAQLDNTQSNSVVIDMLSLERNYILVKTWQVGGPSERALPPRIIPTKISNRDNVEVFPCPLFTSLPPPKFYLNSPTTTSAKPDADINTLLSDPSTVDNEWLTRCQQVLCASLTGKPEQAPSPILPDLLLRAASVLSQSAEQAVFPLIPYTGRGSAINDIQLSSTQRHGMDLTLRYGRQLKLFGSVKEPGDQLTQLMKQVTYYLQQQQRINPKANLRCLQKGTIGYDWFAATMFLMCGGNADRSWQLLHQLSTLVITAYIWPHRLHASTHLPGELTDSGVPVLFSASCHNVELILQVELPHVYSAMKMAGFSPAQICQLWLRQCFWCHVDWPDICHYVLICTVLGVDYQVYICVALLRHLSPKILSQAQDKNLVPFLKEEPITGFRVGHHLAYMQQLQKKFRKIVLPDMQRVSRP